MRAPLDSSADVMDLFVDEAEKMDGSEEVVFLAASVIADVLGATAFDAVERTVILHLAADLFAMRHEPTDPKERMH